MHYGGGRCYLSSYLTGQSPNTFGACSPAEFVRWEDRSGVLESRLNNVLIDRFGTNETAGYPTLCKGRFTLADEPGSTPYHALEEPTSLNTMELLPELLALGIRSLKIEGRQRSAAYVAQVTRAWRQAIDCCRADPAKFLVKMNGRLHSHNWLKAAKPHWVLMNVSGDKSKRF